MKIGTFIAGGLAGAALVMLMRRGRMPMMAGQVGRMLKHRMSDMKEGAVGRMMNMGWSDTGESRHRESSRRESHRASSERGGLAEVAHLASQDASVKREVNDILDQSGQHSI
ncbi:hypothetical protein [Cohnella sp. REN36]|uniref:hypothetical protein n=1 Tax=Cohnella sp. REN36 TaxID=2887347 RepID=UPI001D13A52A|nr:hypothetical protein [Cohnella sp. REN36]MCC3373483.1 hypothetical protein [Cohnella sp. REN36]